VSDNRDLLARLAAGPKFLLVGQGDRRSGYKTLDPTLGLSNGRGVEGPGEPESAMSAEAAFATIDAQAQTEADRNSLGVIAAFPWNGVFTTRIDQPFTDAFAESWRRVVPTGVAQVGRHPRNVTELQIRYLFGGLALPEDERPPRDELSFAVREHLTREILDVLVTRLMTPRGVLVIDRWTLLDWLTPRDMFALAQRLEVGQLHVFSATSEMVHDQFLGAAAALGVLVLHTESLSLTVTEALERGSEGSATGSDRASGRLLPVGDSFIEVSTDAWNRIIGSARPVDLELLEPYTRGSTSLEYQRFHNFLGASEGVPPWKAIASGYKLERDFEPDLLKATRRAVSSADDAGPVILEGQTATGKSLALCWLAQQLARSGEAVVLHSSRRLDRPTSADLEAFSTWAEDQCGLKTVLIWDGMAQADDYFDLQRQVRSRGQRVIVVGSTYLSQAKNSSFVTAKIGLSEREASKASAWLAKHGVEGARPHPGDDSSFLALLYRTLPTTEAGLRRGLALEMRAAAASMEARSLNRKTEDAESARMTAVAQALVAAGFDLTSLTPSESPDGEVAYLTLEERSVAERLSAVILTAGRRKLTVPLELALRVVGRQGSHVVVDLLRDHDIFRWTERGDGAQFIGARTALEADLLAREDLRPKAEADVICTMIRCLRPSPEGFGGDEVQFLFDLMEQVGPQSRRQSELSPWYGDFADALRELRRDGQHVHHRLVLLEANLWREHVHRAQGNGRIPQQERTALLIDVEELLVGALEARDIPSKSRLMLLVELASTRGAQIVELQKNHLESAPDPERISGLMRGVLEAVQQARMINPENIYPVDVLSWSTRSAIETGVVDDTESVHMLADARASLDSMDRTTLSPSQQAMYDRRQHDIARLLKDTPGQTKFLADLMSNDDPAAYYLLAVISLEGDATDAKSVALRLLRQAPASVQADWKCARLLLDLFWEDKTGKKLLRGERVLVGLSKEEWEECLGLADSLVGAAGFDRHRVEFVRGLALFHLGAIQDAQAAFRRIEESGLVVGARVIMAYLATDTSGAAVEYTGRVLSATPDGRHGRVWVDQLGDSVNFIPIRFSPADYRSKNEVLPSFHIAFNFRGPLAEPIRHRRADTP
jgi:hypothetical protein